MRERPWLRRPHTGRLSVLVALTLVGVPACAHHPAPPPSPLQAELPGNARSASGPVRAPHAMVVSAYPLASQAGVAVLRAGGNAVDAAVATGFALAVTHPSAGNIGGGGFMVIRFPDGRTTAIDFREKAPLAANPKMFVDSAGDYSARIQHNSYLSVGVPGTVAGFAYAHKKYGQADWRRLVEPAVRLAGDGFDLSPTLAQSLAYALRALRRYPASLQAFSRNGQPYRAGERFRQPDLARTLERIQEQGRAGFYQGETARLLVAEMKRGGGLITQADLDRYQPQERTPIHGTYRGYDIISMPPPSSGGVALVEMLNILEGYDLAAMGHNTAPYIHHLVEAMRRAYLDRARYLGDPDYVAMPLDRLTGKAYAAQLRASIQDDRASPSLAIDVQQDHESPQTTHFSVVDASGMAVSVTFTLEQGYGSKITVAGAGFLLNNEMGDFNGRPGLTTENGLIGTEANLARPEHRMLSSMTPSIVARNGQLVAVVGSPGGRTIINTVLQVILNMVDFHMNIQAAVDAPRLHHQWLPDVVSIEGDGVDSTVVQQLEAMGHQVRMRGRQGVAHCIMIDPQTGDRLGAADPRDEDGRALGY